MAQPCQESYRACARGYVVYNGKKCWPAVEHPLQHFHGTSALGLLQILERGRVLASGLCDPDGVYSYPDNERSENSSYILQGAQVCFTVKSIPFSYNDSSMFFGKGNIKVPPGISVRRLRSGVQKWGRARGAEWIHSESSCMITAARVKVAPLIQLIFQDTYS